MYRKLSIIALLLIAVAGCGSTKPDQSEKGSRKRIANVVAAFKAHGYKYVGPWMLNNEQAGGIMGHCGTLTVPECDKQFHAAITSEHPAAYVDNDARVRHLEGARIPSGRGNYMLTVPAEYADFANISNEDQKKLLAVMPSVRAALPNPETEKPYNITTSIGNVTVTVLAG